MRRVDPQVHDVGACAVAGRGGRLRFCRSRSQPDRQRSPRAGQRDSCLRGVFQGLRGGDAAGADVHVRRGPAGGHARRGSRAQPVDHALRQRSADHGPDDFAQRRPLPRGRRPLRTLSCRAAGRRVHPAAGGSQQHESGALPGRGGPLEAGGVDAGSGRRDEGARRSVPARESEVDERQRAGERPSDAGRRGPGRQARPDDPARRGRPRAADRVRERRQSAARARGRPSA